MALMFTFVLFGTSLIWGGLTVITPITLLFVLVVFAARLAAFIPALLPAKLSWKDRFLIAWFGPRGLSSLLLVLLPIFANIPGTERLLPMCCMVVLFSVVLHGLSPSFLIRNGVQDPNTSSLASEDLPTQGTKNSSTAACPENTSRTFLPVDTNNTLDSEYVSIEDVKTLLKRPNSILIVDSRSDRSYEESHETIPGAIRLYPHSAVKDASERKLPKDVVLAVLCA
jgi:sodium/hydrogen antiporter